MQENTDQKKLPIWTHSTQWMILVFTLVTEVVIILLRGWIEFCLKMHLSNVEI